VTYWMNRLQGLNDVPPIFVTLNPLREPHVSTLISREVYTHPMFASATEQAQKQLWRLQGVRRTWFCGAHFGAGFHEDGLQSGLAAAEDLGGVQRPWKIANDSGRIYRQTPAAVRPAIELAS
jgi:predicted NAD/FAD-binding protein